MQKLIQFIFAQNRVFRSAYYQSLALRICSALMSTLRKPNTENVCKSGSTRQQTDLHQDPIC